MKLLIYWIRWILLIPVIAVIYYGFQTIAYTLLKPYLHVLIDTLGSYEVISPFLWWILYPLGCLTIGTSSVYVALEIANALAPSHKIQAIRIIAGLILLLILSNVYMILANTKSDTIESILSAIAVNVSAGFTAILYAFSKKEQKR